MGFEDLSEKEKEKLMPTKEDEQRGPRKPYRLFHYGSFEDGPSRSTAAERGKTTEAMNVFALYYMSFEDESFTEDEAIELLISERGEGKQRPRTFLESLVKNGFLNLDPESRKYTVVSTSEESRLTMIDFDPDQSER